PKEMLPIVDTPVIQYVVEEAVAAGLSDILMVIGKGKRAIEEHFDRSFQLEAQLIESGKTKELELIQRVSELANIHFVWQKKMRGLGDAVSYARYHVNNEPFLVLLGDTLIDAEVPAAAQIKKVYEQYKEPVILLEQVEPERVSRYGVIDGQMVERGIYRINDFVEKPSIEDAPSNLVIASRYILTPDIFDYLDRTPPGKGGEIQLTDALKMMVKDRPMYGVLLDGKRCDIGNKEGFVKTNIEFALKRDDMAENLQKYIKGLAEKF
ncbi:MAG: UTP--glucose-1-phosphate uridylyltransferase, partial [Candidatus Brocadiia bacterium]